MLRRSLYNIYIHTCTLFYIFKQISSRLLSLDHGSSRSSPLCLVDNCQVRLTTNSRYMSMLTHQKKMGNNCPHGA